MADRLVSFSFCCRVSFSIHTTASSSTLPTIRTPFKSHRYQHLLTIVMTGMIHSCIHLSLGLVVIMYSYSFVPLQVPIQRPCIGIGFSSSVSFGCIFHPAILQSVTEVSSVIERSRIIGYGIPSVIAVAARQ